MKTIQLSGVIPPLVTPIDAQGNFSVSAMQALLEHVIEAGVDGGLALGSTGEFSQMEAAMRRDLLVNVIEIVRGRIPVLVGIGTPGTQETIALGRHAREAGAAAAMVINPYYTPLSEANLAMHYREIAAKVDMPLFLYNYPGMTGQDLSPALVKDLALSCENIVGIKDSVEAIAHTRQIILEVKPLRPDFMVFSGYDDQMLNTLVLGGDGGVPGTANFAPEVACALYQAFKRQDYAAMVTAHRRIAALTAIYGVDTPVFSAVKEAVRMAGVKIADAVLAPARGLDAQGRARVAAILKSAGIAV